MKSLTSKFVAALLLAASLAGCAGMGDQESAESWMGRQSPTVDE